MPSGKVHDRITILTAVFSWPLWYLLSPVQSYAPYLAGVCAYLFSGFYLSDDLDTRCIALKRWGPLAILWYPYQKLIPHRSWISHGIAIGPIIRVLYFIAVLWIVARCVLWLINVWIMPVNRNTAIGHCALWIAGLLWHHSRPVEWALGGLILGGVAHTLLDTFVSAIKRIW